MGSRLLIHEEPLQVLPSLAVAIGLNEAIILQQIHYWMQKSERRMEGKTWIYNTYMQWQKQFPFWSHDTIKRAVHQLEALGIVISTTRFNRNPIDKTKWYRIAYERLNDFDVPQNVPPTMQDAPSSMQNAPSMGQDASTTVQDALTPREVPPREVPTETTTEIPDPPIIPPGGKDAVSKDAKAVMLYLNKTTGRSYRVPGEIPGCLRRGATIAECLLVIDWWRNVKTVDDPEQEKYFDQDTPFRASKFEKYRAAAAEWDLQGRSAGGAMRVSAKEARTMAASKRIIEDLEHDSSNGQSPIFRSPEHPGQRLLG